jgi:hypothetical protein
MAQIVVHDPKTKITSMYNGKDMCEKCRAAYPRAIFRNQMTKQIDNFQDLTEKYNYYTVEIPDHKDDDISEDFQVLPENDILTNPTLKPLIKPEKSCGGEVCLWLFVFFLLYCMYMFSNPNFIFPNIDNIIQD